MRVGNLGVYTATYTALSCRKSTESRRKPAPPWRRVKLGVAAAARRSGAKVLGKDGQPRGAAACYAIAAAG